MLKNGLKTAHNKSLKISYRGLDRKEIKIIKAIELKERAEKELYGVNGFYQLSKRTQTGAIDWDSLTERELNLFDSLNRKIEKSNKVLNTLSEEEIRKIKITFQNSQFSFSQSF
jgi:oligoendopeptidase F